MEIHREVASLRSDVAKRLRCRQTVAIVSVKPAPIKSLASSAGSRGDRTYILPGVCGMRCSEKSIKIEFFGIKRSSATT